MLRRCGNNPSQPRTRTGASLPDTSQLESRRLCALAGTFSGNPRTFSTSIAMARRCSPVRRPAKIIWFICSWNRPGSKPWRLLRLSTTAFPNRAATGLVFDSGRSRACRTTPRRSKPSCGSWKRRCHEPQGLRTTRSDLPPIRLTASSSSAINRLTQLSSSRKSSSATWNARQTSFNTHSSSISNAPSA